MSSVSLLKDTVTSISSSQTTDNTTITLTFNDGSTISTTFKNNEGPKGEDGKDGKDGKDGDSFPIYKGTDGAPLGWRIGTLIAANNVSFSDSNDYSLYYESSSVTAYYLGDGDPPSHATKLAGTWKGIGVQDREYRNPIGAPPVFLFQRVI